MVKNMSTNAGDSSSIPGLGVSPGGGNSTPVFMPGKSMDKGSWQTPIHGVAKRGSVVKNMSTNASSSIPGLGVSPGGGNSTPVFMPGKSMDKGSWQTPIHGVAKRDTTDLVT